MTETIDIIQLIESNPVTKLTKPYQNRLINKIKDNFSTDEQQLFVASFYCYLNYKNDDFVVDLDNIWEWIGFSQKIRAKELLVKNFKADIDYKFLLHQTGNQKKDGRGGYNKEKILMTVKTFKKMCMKANTSKSNDIHEYYIKLEETLHEVIDEESSGLRKELQFKEYLLDKSEDKLKKLEKKFETKERQKYAISNCVYLISNPNVRPTQEELDKDPNKTFEKIGKTGNANCRLDNYCSGSPGEYKIDHSRKVCSKREESVIESLMLIIFSNYRTKNHINKEREWVATKGDITLETLKNEMDLLVDFMFERKKFYDPDFNPEINNDDHEIDTDKSLDFLCPQCNKSYKYESSLIKHISCSHKENAKKLIKLIKTPSVKAEIVFLDKDEKLVEEIKVDEKESTKETENKIFCEKTDDKESCYEYNDNDNDSEEIEHKVDEEETENKIFCEKTDDKESCYEYNDNDSEEIEHKVDEEEIDNKKLIINPRDFNKFIEECCVVDKLNPDFYCPKSDLRETYKIWSNCTKKDVKKDFDEYINKNFKSGAQFIENSRRNVYRGVKVKQITFTPSEKNLDYERFITEKCGISHHYRISYADFYKNFEDYRRKTDSDYKISPKYKVEIKKYLNSKFFAGRVYISNNEGNGGLHGVIGLGLSVNNYGLKVKKRKNKQVGEYNPETNELLQSFDSIILASKELSIPFTSLNSYIEFSRIHKGKIYKLL